MAKKKATTKKAKTKTTKKAAKKTSKKDVLVVGSKVKAALKGSGKATFNVSGDTLEALNELVYQAVEQAQKRCAANGRKTIRPYDFIA
jgi:histone H3/H4